MHKKASCGSNTVTYSNFAGSSEGHSFENGICTVCGMLNVSLAGSSVTPEGKIGMNFFFEIDGAILANTDAKVRFTIPDVSGDRTVEIPVSQGRKDTSAVPGKTLYIFSCDVYAKQMTDTITAQVIMGENTSEAYQHSVERYARSILAYGTPAYSEECIALVKAMLNYGAYAQTNFGYNTDNLANASLRENEKSVSGVQDSDLDQYACEAVTVEGIGIFAGTSLVLESMTTLNVYFAPAAGVDGDTLTFTADGNNAAPTRVENGYYVITLENIAAQDLEKEYVFTVSNGSVSGSFSTTALTYAYSVMQQATDEVTYTAALKNLLRAMYLYNTAADAYFASLNN